MVRGVNARGFAKYDRWSGAFWPIVIVLSVASAAAVFYAVNVRSSADYYAKELSGRAEKTFSLEEELAERERRLMAVVERLKKERSAKKEAKRELESLIEEKKQLEVKVREYADRIARGEPEIVVITKQYVTSASGQPVVEARAPKAPSGEVRRPSVDGRILMVDKENLFVTIDLGGAEGIKLADVLSVYRDNKFIGSIRANRIDQEKSVAYILPGWQRVEFRENDSVQMR